MISNLGLAENKQVCLKAKICDDFHICTLPIYSLKKKQIFANIFYFQEWLLFINIISLIIFTMMKIVTP